MPIAVQHRPAAENNRGNIHRCSRHDAGWRRLVAARRQHNAVKRVAIKHFHETEISEVAIKRRSRPLAGFLNRMHRKLECDTARSGDSLAHAFSEIKMMPVARRQIGTRLRNADDRLA